MKQLYNLKTNVTIKTRILCFTGLFALFLVLSSVTVNAGGTRSPVLTVVKSASPTSYNAVGQTIVYTYNITNSGTGDFTGNIPITDNRTGIFNITNSDLQPGQSIIGNSTYTITQADLDAGSVTNSAYPLEYVTVNGYIFTAQEIGSNTANATVIASQNPALVIEKLASPTSYNAVGQTITYSYFVTNSGNVDLTGKINVIDNLTGTIPISTNGISSSSSLIGTSIHTITQADLDAGSVTNSAYATGSFNNQPVISSNATATVIYENPTSSDGLTNNFGSPNDGGFNNGGYSGAIIPVPMYGSPVYNSEPYWYGNEPTNIIKVSNSNYHNHKAKASSSNGAKAKLSSSKHKAHFNKHEQKNHTKKHKIEQNQQL
jgi:uncharacterized repeat protein (TIGR01451 family)